MSPARIRRAPMCLFRARRVSFRGRAQTVPLSVYYANTVIIGAGDNVVFLNN